MSERFVWLLAGFWAGAFVASVCFWVWMWNAIAEGEFGGDEAEVEDGPVQDAR